MRKLDIDKNDSIQYKIKAIYIRESKLIYHLLEHYYLVLK